MEGQERSLGLQRVGLGIGRIEGEEGERDGDIGKRREGEVIGAFFNRLMIYSGWREGQD